MKRILVATLIAALGVGFVATDVQARRLGGGMSQGMKRQAPPAAAPQPTPAAPATAAAKPATPAQAQAPAAAPKRSWMGPIAGLAAGLGIAALMSHLGLGAAFGNFIMMALLALVAIIAIRFVMARMRAQPSAAAAGAGSAGTMNLPPNAFAAAPPATLATPRAIEPSFAAPAADDNAPRLDTAAFERIAKLIFLRMQAANDSGDLEDLRQSSTPEMFAAFRLDLQERATSQRTDVVKLDAQVLDSAEEDGKQIVSVRFHGLLRETAGSAAEPFDETWHFVKRADSTSTQWLIAGILQNA